MNFKDLFDRVTPSFAPRMAMDDTFQTQPQSEYYTIVIDCLIHVLTTSWSKATGAVCQPKCF